MMKAPQAYHATHDVIRESWPQTMDGVLAKARAAGAEAFVLPGEDEDTSGWAALAVRDLLRVTGG